MPKYKIHGYESTRQDVQVGDDWKKEWVLSGDWTQEKEFDSLAEAQEWREEHTRSTETESTVYRVDC